MHFEFGQKGICRLRNLSVLCGLYSSEKKFSLCGNNDTKCFEDSRIPILIVHNHPLFHCFGVVI